MTQESEVRTASNPTVSELIAALSKFDGDKVVSPYVARFSPDPNTVINVTDAVVLHVFDDFASGQGSHEQVAQFDISVAEFVPEPGYQHDTHAIPDDAE